MSRMVAGANTYFPEFPGWHARALDTDRWGDATSVEYESSVGLLEADHSGTWKAVLDGKLERGKWDPDKPATLKRVLDMLAARRQRWEAEVKEFARRLEATHKGWTCHVDADSISCELASDSPYSEATVFVTSDFLDSLMTDGDAEARIRYQEGSDYMGAFGVYDERVEIHSLSELESLLDRGEQIFRERYRPNGKRAPKFHVGDLVRYMPFGQRESLVYGTVKSKPSKAGYVTITLSGRFPTDVRARLSELEAAYPGEHEPNASKRPLRPRYAGPESYSPPFRKRWSEIRSRYPEAYVTPGLGWSGPGWEQLAEEMQVLENEWEAAGYPGMQEAFAKRYPMRENKPNGARYYVWIMSADGHSILESEGPWGPHDIESAKDFARIGAQKSGRGHGRVVTFGKDPKAKDFRVVQVYE